MSAAPTTPISRAEDGVKVKTGEAEAVWFCDRGGFWGTINQLVLCAKCGKNEFKRHDEPRHYAHICKPSIHVFCDDCYDSLPDGDAA